MPSPATDVECRAEGAWHAISPVDVPADGRVRSVTVDGRSIALTRCDRALGALENRGPHQGGPLGEGSIEKGLLRCPWHGYDYDPITGRPPGDFADTVSSYDIEERADGVYVRLPDLESKGQPVLMSGYLGSIGFGYPAAIGAWAADPARPVVAVTGDGGFGQYATELTTAVKYGIPIKHVLLNNNALGKISKEQLAADYPVWHTSLQNPDWAAYAELCGATGIRVTSRDQLDKAMTALFAAAGPALLCIEQDAELL